jgi:hypothetical protein
MNEQRFETGKSPHVVVGECGGTLVVGSWKGTAVLAQSTELTTDTPGPDQLHLSSSTDLTLTVPEKASLTIKSCAGPLTIKHVDGFISIGTAVQTVTLHNVGSAKIEGVQGALHAENISGPLNLGQAQTVSLRNVKDVTVSGTNGEVTIQFAVGAVELGQVNGRIYLHTINGPVTIQQGSEVHLSNLGSANQVSGITGELRLVGGLANGEHSFQSEGDIYVAWPVDAPITLLAEAAVIDNQLLLANAATTKLDDGRTRLTGHIEQGKPFVSVKTTGNIGLKALRPGETAVLSGADFDFSIPPPTLADVVATAVAATFPDATPAQIEQITAAIESHLAQVEQTITQPTPSPGQIAAAQAQKKVEKSLQKAEGSIAQAQAQLTQPPQPEAAQPESAPPASTAPSQTQILQLLKDGHITIEQANLLLDSLRDA